MNEHQCEHQRRRDDMSWNPDPECSMKQQQRIDASRSYRSLDCRNQQIAFFVSGETRRSLFKLLTRLGHQKLQRLAPRQLPPQKRAREKPRIHSIANLVLQPTLTL